MWAMSGRSSGRARSVRKGWVLATGVVGLASALTAAALVAPNRAAAAAQTYVPRDAATIVAHVPPRDAREVAERQALAAAADLEPARAFYPVACDGACLWFGRRAVVG